MVMPNFLIVGAHKSGTTSLYHYLRQHPQIYMSPQKEPGFFVYEDAPPDFTGPGTATRLRDEITDIEAYRRLFDGVRDELAIGEASGIYMQQSRAVERIRHYVPEARIVAILRDPASRVFSSFTQLRRDGYEPEADLRKALAKEDERRAQNWGYAWYHRRRGFTHDILKQYIEAFGRDRVRVYLYDDLCDDPAKLLADLFTFLDVDPGFRPDVAQRFNVSGVPKFPRLHRLVAGPTALNRLAHWLLPFSTRSYIRARTIDRLQVRVRLDDAMRRELIAIYRDDILRLQELIGRDLQHWLDPSRTDAGTTNSE